MIFTMNDLTLARQIYDGCLHAKLQLHVKKRLSFLTCEKNFCFSAHESLQFLTLCQGANVVVAGEAA